MVVIDDWQATLRRLAKWASLRDRKIGERKQFLRRMREEYGCRTIAEMEELYARLMAQWRKAAKKIARMTKEFDRKYGAKLKDFDA